MFTGDLGTSYTLGFNISSEIRRRFGPTLMITTGTLLVSIPLSLVLGTYSAINVKKVHGVVDIMMLGRPVVGAGLRRMRLDLLPTGGYVPLTDTVVASPSSPSASGSRWCSPATSAPR